MTAPRYGWDHQQQRLRALEELRFAGSGRCAESVCVMPSRLITPAMELHLCHDVTDGRVLGLGHEKCNLAEANRRQKERRKRTTPAGDVTTLKW